jgi:choline dehydrogenase-like flavoprotein
MANLVRKREPLDAIVVGSGVSGGWAAKQLTEAWLCVALIEVGGIDSEKGFHRARDTLPGEILGLIATGSEEASYSIAQSRLHGVHQRMVCDQL